MAWMALMKQTKLIAMAGVCGNSLPKLDFYSWDAYTRDD